MKTEKNVLEKQTAWESRNAEKVMMSLIERNSYGESKVLKLKKSSIPEPKVGELRIKVISAGVNAGDYHILTGKPYLLRMMGYGIFKPSIKTLGQDFSGIVDSIGEGNSSFKVGDIVFGQVDSGSFAEYICLSENNIELVPDSIDPVDAGAIPVAMIAALQGLKLGNLKSGDKILINGASGGVGTFAIQIAKAIGLNVTGVCSTGNISLMKKLGADKIIDYKKENLFETDEKYDLIFDLVGNYKIKYYKSILKPKGSFISASSGKGNWIKPILSMLKLQIFSLIGEQKFIPLISNFNKLDFLEIKELIAKGNVFPVINKKYSLSQTSEALKVQGEGRVFGKNLIVMDE